MKGVTYDKSVGRYVVRFTFNGKRRYLGYVDSYEEAYFIIRAARDCTSLNDTRKCFTCGESLAGKNKKTKYCSTKCRYLDPAVRIRDRELLNNRYSAYKDRIRKLLSIGVSEFMFVSMMDNQKGCCDICGDSLIYPDSWRAPAVDHDHITGVIRGLLCHDCNLGLGLFKDNSDNLISATTYLEKY